MRDFDFATPKGGTLGCLQWIRDEVWLGCPDWFESAQFSGPASQRIEGNRVAALAPRPLQESSYRIACKFAAFRACDFVFFAMLISVSDVWPAILIQRGGC